MARSNASSPRVPKLCRRKDSGRGYVSVRLEGGSRRQVYLRGKPGSREEAEHYREIVAAVLAGAPVPLPDSRSDGAGGPTVADLVAAWFEHAERYYRRPDGTISGEVETSRYPMRHLLAALRDQPVASVTIHDLQYVQRRLIDWRGGPSDRVERLARSTINGHLYRILRTFKWGVSAGLVPGAVWHELSALEMVRKDRYGVPDRPPVEAVPWVDVEPVLEQLTPTLRDAVLVQHSTGMRPGEVLAMTWREIDTAGDVWLYAPAQHKTRHRGGSRTVALGPEAQEVLRRRRKLDPGAAIFSPREAWDEHRAAKRAERQTPITAQTKARDKRAEDQAPKAAFYGTAEYRRAIHRACDRAGIPRWSPHRLRHAAGTRIAQEFGLEAARAALGHRELATTRRYAKAAETTLAQEVARRLG